MFKQNYILLTLIFIAFSFTASGKKKTLAFKNDGSFKIIQFTDTHYLYDSPKSIKVIEMINEVLDAEQPDLVIFTGDVVTKAPLIKGWLKITGPLVERKIPWAVTLGNHDDEQDQKRENVLPLISDIPYNLTSTSEKKVFGYGNYILPLKSNTKNETCALLYCMDSNAYPTIEGINGYGWFHQSQINWYRGKSMHWIKKNDGTPIPSLAFFHIPLPEYIESWEKGDMTPIGVKNQNICAPKINTGMFAAMLEQNDVMGIFVGHDHFNDYIASLHGIALAYGHYSGGDTVPGYLINGARVIVLKEGTRHFSTWIRLKGGEKINEFNY